jgi:TolA-binding protein
MKTKLILSFLGLLLITGCSKSAGDLFELSNENIKNNEIDQAITDLETLVTKYPQDSLASLAQYKLATINLNWKNNLGTGYAALQATVNNYSGSIHGAQAQKEIDQFPEYILNKAESLRKRKMVKEAVEHLMYMTEKYSQHELTPKGQYMLGDLYMNEFRDFTTAIQEYRKVIENYTGSSQEAHALFMIGYIYANVVNDPKSAEIEYNEFLKRFPTHELTPSVKFEIEFLGKGIEEIPALKHITS